MLLGSLLVGDQVICAKSCEIRKIVFCALNVFLRSNLTVDKVIFDSYSVEVDTESKDL